MRLIDGIRGRIEGLLTAPGRELGSWARFLRFQVHLWRFCARRLREHNVTAMSAALCFRTLFAMIPAIVLAVLVLKSIGVLEDSKASLRRVLAGSGFDQIAVVESTAQEADEGDAAQKRINAAEKIESIVSEVESKLTFGRLGPVGAALLIWTALTLLTTVERSLNRIFGADRARPLGRRLIVYWSALTLGPLVWVVASVTGRRLVQVAENLPGLSWLLSLTGWLGPVVVGIMVVAAVYKLIPHTHVRFRAAFGGAVVAVPLWLIAKWGFSAYVNAFVGTDNLYGSLGLLPLFLIWLNVSWLIFLFGAELAHTAANLSRMQIAEQVKDDVTQPSDLLAAALVVAESFLAGRGPAVVEAVASRLRLPPEMVLRLLDTLATYRIVCRVEDATEPAYVLARPAEAISVLTILGLERPERTPAPDREYEPDILRRVDGVREQARLAIGGYTLADAVGDVDSRADAAAAMH